MNLFNCFMKELGIITRKCKKSDYFFVFNLVKKTLWPYISRYIKPKKDKFDQGFFEDHRGLGYKHITILMKGRRRIGFTSVIGRDFNWERFRKN